jgi:hypothetical protein
MHQMRRKMMLKKDSFMGIQGGFQSFSYHMKNLLVDFNAKVGREVILKLPIWNDNLHQDSNDNGARSFIL